LLALRGRIRNNAASSFWLARMLTFVVVLLGWIFSVCVHEFGHAVVAYRGGDHTVVEKGYLTLNPMKYLDPVNSVVFPIIILLMGGIGLPGASVYIRTDLLRSAAIESAVSAAGPAANLILLIILAISLHVPVVYNSDLAPALGYLALLQSFAFIFNLLPLPGFDGFGVIAPHLDINTRRSLMQYAAYSMFGVLFVFMFIPGASTFFFLLCAKLLSIVGVDVRLAFEGMREFRFWKN
jgi:Zn-dependent protease